MDNPKQVNYSIRLNLEMEERLQAHCKAHGITKGEAIRQGIELLLAQEK